jgi:hypothetical protein
MWDYGDLEDCGRVKGCGGVEDGRTGGLEDCGARVLCTIKNAVPVTPRPHLRRLAPRLRYHMRSYDLRSFLQYLGYLGKVFHKSISLPFLSSIHIPNKPTSPVYSPTDPIIVHPRNSSYSFQSHSYRPHLSANPSLPIVQRCHQAGLALAQKTRPVTNSKMTTTPASRLR